MSPKNWKWEETTKTERSSSKIKFECGKINEGDQPCYHNMVLQLKFCGLHSSYGPSFDYFNWWIIVVDVTSKEKMGWISTKMTKGFGIANKHTNMALSPSPEEWWIPWTVPKAFMTWEQLIDVIQGVWSYQVLF